MPHTGTRWFLRGELRGHFGLEPPRSTTHFIDGLFEWWEPGPSGAPRRGREAARVPENRNLVPPGYYMLFAVNRAGVPAVAPWVHIV